MQHGDAVDKSIDPERPLSQQGIDDIQHLAWRMQTMGVQLAHIFHSGKLRAEQTAEIIAQEVAPAVQPLQLNGLNPNDDPSGIAEDIGKMADNILITSHMPFVSRLCSRLLAGHSDIEFASEPGTLFCLEKQGKHWRLVGMIRPDFN